MHKEKTTLQATGSMKCRLGQGLIPVCEDKNATFSDSIVNVSCVGAPWWHQDDGFLRSDCGHQAEAAVCSEAAAAAAAKHNPQATNS